jgi:hypothetical protein
MIYSNPDRAKFLDSSINHRRSVHKDVTSPTLVDSIHKSLLCVEKILKAEPGQLLIKKLMLQGHNNSRLKSSFRKLYGRSNNLVCDYKLFVWCIDFLEPHEQFFSYLAAVTNADDALSNLDLQMYMYA